MYNSALSPKSSKGFSNPEKFLGKSLPDSSQAERSVLAAILLRDENLVTVSEILQPHDFYSPVHRTIYRAMLDLAGTHKRIDLVMLHDELTKKGVLEENGGMSYLVSLQEDIPSIGLVVQHSKIIKEKAILRELITSAAQIITQCYTQDTASIDTVLDTAEKLIFDIAYKRSQSGFVQLDIWLKRTFQHLSEIKNHGKGITGVPSGLRKLDSMTSGFQKGDLIVIAARPSMGKTGLAMGLASYASSVGAPVGVFSLEMSAEQLILRLLSSESGIAQHSIRNATISSQEWIELTHVAARLAEMKIFIDDTATLDITELRIRARKLKMEKDIQLLVIDYLQLISSSRRYENRHQEVSEISRSLKALAKELNIPIIALSQLSRAVDSRVDKRPMLSDLRESGAIEQDADLIMFIYREAAYNPETENFNRAELIIGKQRNGPTGVVVLNFIRELIRFEDSEDE